MISFVSFAMTASIIVVPTGTLHQRVDPSVAPLPPKRPAYASTESELRKKDSTSLSRNTPNTADLQKPTAVKPNPRWILGIEATGFQIPSLRLPQIEFDRRVLGKSTQLGGGGLFLRRQMERSVAIEGTIRSGFVRYRDREGESILHGLMAFDLGAIAYLAHGKAGRLGLDAGLGGIYNFYHYKLGLDWGSGSQHFGSFHIRGGIDAEFVQNHFLIGMTVRSYGVVTPRRPTRQIGDVFEKLNQSSKNLPLTRFQTYLVASIGVGYIF